MPTYFNQSMVLKTGWERFKTHVPLDITTAEKLLRPFTQNKIAQLHLCSEGLANTNYKVTFTSHHPPIVLRIYMREHSACQRELALHTLLKGKLPIAQILHADDSCSIIPYPFAVMEWVDGVLMREVVLSGEGDAIHRCAFEAGKYLAILREITFPQGGFFQEGLKIRPFNQDERYLPFCRALLEKPEVKNSLGDQLCEAVYQLTEIYAHFCPDENNANLTHGDYDPANILVKQIHQQWKITAILDWEFSFSCSYLLDMGMFLRYSHRLPSGYEKNFQAGIETTSGPLPAHWKKSAKLTDIICLLSLIYWNPKEKSPNLHHDVVSLIQDTLKNWEN